MYEVYSIFFSLIPHEEPAGVRKSNREERYTVKERQVACGPLCSLGSYSPTIYAQLLCVQIPKAKKVSQFISVFLHAWDLTMPKLLVEC